MNNSLLFLFGHSFLFFLLSLYQLQFWKYSYFVCELYFPFKVKGTVHLNKYYDEYRICVSSFRLINYLSYLSIWTCHDPLYHQSNERITLRFVYLFLSSLPCRTVLPRNCFVLQMLMNSRKD